MSRLQDTGDFLEVPEDQQLEEDDYVPEEDNRDEFEDLSSVPAGAYVVLSTAGDEADDEDEDGEF